MGSLGVFASTPGQLRPGQIPGRDATFSDDVLGWRRRPRSQISLYANGRISHFARQGPQSGLDVFVVAVVGFGQSGDKTPRSGEAGNTLVQIFEPLMETCAPFVTGFFLVALPSGGPSRVCLLM